MTAQAIVTLVGVVLSLMMGILTLINGWMVAAMRSAAQKREEMAQNIAVMISKMEAFDSEIQRNRNNLHDLRNNELPRIVTALTQHSGRMDAQDVKISNLEGHIISVDTRLSEHIALANGGSV